MQRFLVVFILGCTLSAFALLVWWQIGTRRANQLVSEANTEIEAFNSALAEAKANYDHLFNDVNERNFPQNRARWERMARETAALYEKSAAHARAASGKFDEAARRPTNEAVVAYNRALSARFAKRAERCDLLKEYALLWVDPTLHSADALTAKQTEINHRLAPILAAEEASDKEADRIAATHPNQFE